MSKKSEIVKHIGVYSIATQIAQGITMVAGILTRNFLGPMQMGIWSTLQIVLEYAKYTALGVTEAVSREIPYYQGKDDPEKCEEIKGIVASFSILTSCVTATLIILFALFFRSHMPEPMFFGLLGLGALVVLQRVNNLLISILRAYKQFTLAGHQAIWSALVNVALVAYFSYHYKIYGFMIAMALSFIFNILYVLFFWKFSFRWQLSKLLGPLIAFGFPLMLLGLVQTIFTSLDRILVVKMLGFKSLGLYSVPDMAGQFLERIPNAIGIVLIPHFHEKFGKRDQASDLISYIHRAQEGLSIVMPFLIGISWLCLPFLIRILLPAYVPSVRAAQFLILGTYFVAMAQPYGNFIIAIKKHLFIFPIIFSALLLEFLLVLVAIRSGLGIQGVALATSFSLFVFFLVISALAWRILKSRKDFLDGMRHVLLRFVVMLTLAVFLESTIRLPALFLNTLVQCVLFLVLFTLLYRSEFFRWFKWILSKKEPA